MRLIYYILITFTTLLFLTRCSPTKHLKENEYLLFRQSIKGNKAISSEELSALYRQKTNRRFLGIMPYVAIYNLGRKSYDTAKINRKMRETKAQYEKKIMASTDSAKKERLISKEEDEISKYEKTLGEGNWLMRAPGEAPVLFDSALISETAQQMGYYLFSKGYFRGSVKQMHDTSGKKIRVKYLIKEGIPITIRDINYIIADPEIRRLTETSSKQSALRVNDIYDLQKINDERERLTRLMKDNGYFDFSRQFIFFNVDTSETRGRADIDIIIKNPKNESHHKYLIDSVFFEMDVANKRIYVRDTMEDLKAKGLFYLYYRKNFSPKILYYKQRFKPGDLYSQKKVQETQNQIASLDMYKFININFVKNRDTSIHEMNAYIRTSPFDKFQISDEWGVNVGQGFIPGPYATLTFKDRNVFRGFEVFEASLRYSMEAVYPQNRQENDPPILMKEYGGTVSLSFPQILFPGFQKRVHHYNPKTRIQTGYNFVNRPEYTRGTFRTALGYTWQKNRYRQYNINIADINIISTPRKDPLFDTLLVRLERLGNKLSVSFRNSIVTSFNAYYVYNNNDFNSRKKSQYFKPTFELGGVVPNILSRFITKEPGNILFGLQYFEFYRLSIDYRRYYPVAKKSTYAMRYYVGYAKPYGSSAKNGLFVLPYEKYFFTGGSGSIRAWKPRRLGPGSYKDTVNGYRFEQPGNIVFEMNQEFRFDIISFLHGAFFIDAGNVWTINNVPGKPGGQFNFSTFLSQIAVGSGAGLRMDFTFLILRFDLGLKIWDPGEKGANRFVGKYLIKNPPFGRPGQALLNIGIGYPF